MIGFMMMLNVKAKLQYGRTLLYEVISYLVRYPVEFVAAWIILYNFGTLDGWDFYQLLFMQAMSFVVISLSCAFTWEPMAAMESYVVEGKLDQFLIAPVNPFWYVIGMNFRATNLVIAAICGAIAAFAGYLAGIALSIRLIFYFMGMAGAVLIIASFNIFLGTLSFWIMQTHQILSFMIDTVGEFLKYPIGIYEKGLRIVLTFFIPVALANYYPAGYLFGKTEAGWSYMAIIFCVGCGLFYLAYRFWFFGVKNYTSAGG